MKLICNCLYVAVAAIINTRQQNCMQLSNYIHPVSHRQNGLECNVKSTEKKPICTCSASTSSKEIEKILLHCWYTTALSLCLIMKELKAKSFSFVGSLFYFWSPVKYTSRISA